MPGQSWVECLVESQSDGAALTAAAEASMLPAAAQFTLPANHINRVGKMYKIEAFGKISSVITTPGTARFKVEFGGTEVFDSLAILLDSVAAHTDVGWMLEIWLRSTVIGTSAALYGWGRWTCEDILGVPATAPKGVLSAILPWNSAPAAGATFDSTAAQQVDVHFVQTVATGSLTCQGYAFYSLN